MFEIAVLYYYRTAGTRFGRTLKETPINSSIS